MNTDRFRLVFETAYYDQINEDVVLGETGYINVPKNYSYSLVVTANDIEKYGLSDYLKAGYSRICISVVYEDESKDTMGYIIRTANDDGTPIVV